MEKGIGPLDLALTCLGIATRAIEGLLFVLVQWYDSYVYSPLQMALWPAVEKVPRSVAVQGKEYTVFSANIVSWLRTFLVVPIALCIKYNLCWVAFLLVLAHDFFDHLDGIVAKVQRQLLGPVDDPLLGGFMDAFCDKIVNVLALWSIVLLTDFSGMSWFQGVSFVTPCIIIIAYEFTLGVVRVQDYFRSYYLREFKKSDDIPSSSTAAVMEGKLKEKLESLGIAFLCLAHGASNALDTYSGITGLVCLVLSIRLAHASLQHKLDSRLQKHKRKQEVKVIEEEEEELEKEKGQDKEDGKRSTGVQVQVPQILDNSELERKEESKLIENVDVQSIRNELCLMNIHLDARYDKVYTIGCFDLFHYGHVMLMQRMRAIGKRVVVGVHDSRSIYMLKKRVPIDGTHTRMLNCKKHADVVFCIAGTDPTTYIQSVVDLSAGERSVYVRGADMPNFPSRSWVEKHMDIKFLPYTEGVSSTKLRKELLNKNNSTHVNSRFDDLNLFY